ncbi:30248_t:CDS:2 [Gigaspora margarita]|uniref:30248_t:CDS:1 n=1 Tax=Gigaspora margarita TaxID=4874 RepID=A0ABN7VFI9_GIGMA|nr:30248_t:CDS:2 [Gigaspora margarita]
MSISSDDLDNSPEECSDKKALQIQLNNKSYISDLDNDNIKIEQNKKEIIQELQDISFEEAVAINENDLDKNLELTQKIQFYSSHTGESIANKVYSLLEEFKIETKVIVLTTDNGSNMISAANFLQVNLK